MKTMLIALCLALTATAQDGKKPARCIGCEKETFGTTVVWEGTPTEAGARAKKEEKLLFILHVSGDFSGHPAPALRGGALANPEVGTYLNANFASSFQKVAGFPVVNGPKRGGNVASYFCAPDGRVLHAIAGPVDAATFLREARWIVETAKTLVAESVTSETPFRTLLRRRHAERLRAEHGLVVEAAGFDVDALPQPDDVLTYRDPSGRPLVPVLPPPPIGGPDVAVRAAREAAAGDPPHLVERDKAGRRWAMPAAARVHQLMSSYAMLKIERLYGTVFENILGERIGTGLETALCPTCETRRQLPE